MVEDCAETHPKEIVSARRALARALAQGVNVLAITGRGSPDQLAEIIRDADRHVPIAIV